MLSIAWFDAIKQRIIWWFPNQMPLRFALIINLSDNQFWSKPFEREMRSQATALISLIQLIAVIELLGIYKLKITWIFFRGKSKSFSTQSLLQWPEWGESVMKSFAINYSNHLIGPQIDGRHWMPRACIGVSHRCLIGEGFEESDRLFNKTLVINSSDNVKNHVFALRIHRWHRWHCHNDQQQYDCLNHCLTHPLYR